MIVPFFDDTYDVSIMVIVMMLMIVIIIMITHGRSMPARNRPRIGPLTAPDTRVPTSSMPGKNLVAANWLFVN